MRPSVPSQSQRRKEPFTVLRFGRSFGRAEHWHSVRRMSVTPYSSTLRLWPPRLAGAINGAVSEYAVSVGSLGYRSVLRL